MPIKIQNELPAKGVLEKENIFVMDENRAVSQDIRPLQILILNLMPLKEETELQLLRLLSNSPLQVDAQFMAMDSHNAKNTSSVHLKKFYMKFKDIKDRHFDGMIITGAPVENLDYEDVDYWNELTSVMDWTRNNVTSTLFICWAAQAGLHHFYGLNKEKLSHKIFGVYWHKVLNTKDPLVRGFDEIFLAPHSRYTEIPIAEIRKCPQITILSESKKAGFFLGMSDGGKQIFVMGHPEYDMYTLQNEYRRDIDKGLKIKKPVNYYEDNDPNKKPLYLWKSHASILYSNWLNYYVYQLAPY